PGNPRPQHPQHHPTADVRGFARWLPAHAPAQRAGVNLGLCSSFGAATPFAPKREDGSARPGSLGGETLWDSSVSAVRKATSAFDSSGVKLSRRIRESLFGAFPAPPL